MGDLTQRQKKGLEKLAKENGLGCGECGSDSFDAVGVQWAFGVPDHSVQAVYKCRGCVTEKTLEMSNGEAESAGIQIEKIHRPEI